MKPFLFLISFSFLLAPFFPSTLAAKEKKQWWHDYDQYKAKPKKASEKKKASIDGTYVSFTGTPLKITLLLDEEGTFELIEEVIEDEKYEKSSTTGTWSHKGNLVTMYYGEIHDVLEFSQEKPWLGTSKYPGLTQIEPISASSLIKGHGLWKDRVRWK